MFFLILISQTEDLPQFFIQQYVSHPIDINSASIEELKQIPFLSSEDVEKIIKYRPFKGYAEFRRLLNLSYREFLLIRPYIMIPVKPFNGYVSTYGGVQFLSSTNRNLNNNTIFDTILNKISDYEIDIQAYYKYYAIRIKDYNITDTIVQGNDTSFRYYNRFRFIFNTFGNNMAFRFGNFGPRVGYGAISYRPRYYFISYPSFNFPVSNLALEYRYKFVGLFVDTTKNLFFYGNYKNFYLGYINANYDAIWSFLEINPIGKFYATFEGSYGKNGYSYGYSIQYRDRGLFFFYTQNFFKGDRLWRYNYWQDSSFLYVYISFFPIDLRMNMRNDRGSISATYEISRFSYIFLRHYRHPFFNSYQIAYNHTRGGYASFEKIKNGSILTVGYNLKIGRKFEDPYIKVRIYYYNTCMIDPNCFVNNDNLYYQPYDPESYLNIFYWSAYEGFFPAIDSRIELYGSGTRFSLSVRYKRLYFRFIDGGRYDLGIERAFFF